MTSNINSGLILKVVFILLTFFSSGQSSFLECQSSLENIVVYEGTLNTLISCSNGPNGTAWSLRPTSNASISFYITNFNDTISPALTGLFAFNQTGLVIRNATLASVANSPITTAGVYFVSFDPANPNGNRTAFKVVVIRSGPTCSCVQLSTGNVSVSCTIVYVDYPSYPIYAMMSCTGNGQSYNATTPMRTLVPSNSSQYVWNSTSTVTAKDTGPTIYDCFTTLAAPLVPISYWAKNAPDFSATRQVQCGAITTSQAAATRASTTAIAPDGISERGKIGIGVGIGISAMLVIGVVLFAVLCSRYKWIKRTETGNQVVGNNETNRTEDYEQMTANSDTAQYETIDV